MTPAFRKKIALLGGILLVTAGAYLRGQEDSLEKLPGLRDRAVVMHMVSRIVEENQQVAWNAETTKVTIPGRPVGLKLIGSDVVVAVQFTPFLRHRRMTHQKLTLVAQAQIWINIPDQGISYHTTMQTIPLEWGEEVYFFPLGSVKGEADGRIEIQLMLEPYSESTRPINAGTAETEEGQPPPP